MDMLKVAQDYAAGGWNVFPVHGIIDGLCTCGNIHCDTKHRGKHPATVKGLNDATADAHDLMLLWKKRNGLNVALATGAGSGVWVLDVDGEAGRQALENLEDTYGRLPDTLIASTGKGLHIYFAHPNKKVKSRVGNKALLGEGLDVRGDGGYVILPPSRHASGRQYVWTNNSPIVAAPQWLVDKVTADSLHTPASSRTYDTSSYERDQTWTSEDVRRMLDHVDPDAPYDEWIAVGMAIKDGGYEFGLWDDWSKRGSKYTTGCTVVRWGGFRPDGGISMGTLVDMAMRGGFKPEARDHYEGPDMYAKDHPARALLDRLWYEQGLKVSKYFVPPANVQKVPDSTPFEPAGERSGEINAVNAPEPAQSVPHTVQEAPTLQPHMLAGLIGETVAWILDNAMLRQPEVTFATVLGAMGAVFGRRYKTDFNTRSNLYLVAIAETGTGKDHPRKMIKSLVEAAGLGQYIGGDTLISPAGLLQGLRTKPSNFMMLDEYGLLLQEMNDKNSAKNYTAKVLMSLYSDSGSTYIGGQYADAKREPIIIHAPNLCIIGTTTLESYTGALKEEAIKSGSLNRYIVMQPAQAFPQINLDMVPNYTPPKDLVQKWAALVDKTSLAGVNTAEVVPVPINVDMQAVAAEFKALRLEQYEKMQSTKDDYGALWVRFAENAVKVAMIFAIARNHVRPVMSPADLEIGERIVRRSILDMIDMAENHMTTSAEDADMKKLLQYLKRKRGNKMEVRSALARALHFGKKRLDTTIDNLLDQRRIEVEKVGKATYYKLVE